MTNTTRPASAPRPEPRDPQGGFAVVAVLIMITLMLSVGLTYMQHAALAPESSDSSRDRLSAAEAIDSGMAIERQALLAGRNTGNSTVVVGDSEATVSVSELSTPGHLRWDISSTDVNDLGATVLVEARRIAAPNDEGMGHPDLLPKLDPDLLTDLLADPDVNISAYSGNVTLENMVINGLLVLEDGATVTVRDLVVNGAIVSRSALETDAMGDFDPSTAPELVIDGSLLVNPTSDLDGVAVLMPDGILGTSNSMNDSFQLLGAVVSHTVDLQGQGSIDGAVAFGTMNMGGDVRRPGYGRLPLELPDVFDSGSANEDVFLAVIPLPQDAADVTALTGFWDDEGDP